MLPSGIVPHPHSLGLAISALFSSIPLSMYGNLLVVYCLSRLCVCGACVCVVDYACLMYMCMRVRCVWYVGVGVVVCGKMRLVIIVDN